MSLRRIARVVAAGIAGLCAAGCAVLPDSIAGLPEQYLGEHIRISADFENVAGLYAGNEVAVLGVPVGRVETVTPRGSYVEVTMALDRDVEVPADAMAALISPQLITNRHVELAPAYRGDGPTLTDGAHIQIGRAHV